MKILIIDMDREMAQYESDCLKTFRYDCDISESGQEGLKMAVDNDYCCIILETDLNGAIDGFLICSQIRKQKNIPIIFISDCGNESAKIRAFGVGADDYITKPFDMEEVLARIESNLRRVQFQNSQTECLQYNNLTLDLEKNTAFLNGIELSLTAKEFGILELLMKYPDKVFSKSNLFQSVWDTEYIAEDNTLNVHISNLRNKLKAICSDTEFIDTVWGIGYRLHKAKG